MKALDNSRFVSIAFWLPAIIAGSISWIMFITVGDTPLIRAGGLALVVVGVTLTLQRMSSTLAVAGGLALAFSSAFWSQTGGGASEGPATIVLAILAAMLISSLAIWLSRRPYLALLMGMIVFAVIFWSQVGTPRSLRLTSLLAAWLMFVLVDALRASNPRPDEPPPHPIHPRQYIAILIILMLGVINDPLFVLLTPAVAMGLWLSNTRIPVPYWLFLLGVFLFGVRGIIVTYIDMSWWSASALEAHRANIRVKYIIADGWREGQRWVNLIQLLITQFTPLGTALAVLGLARMSRWHPVLGIVLMLAYAFYALFGLMYFGSDREILLIPMYIVQIIWLTYAAHALMQWLSKNARPGPTTAKWVVNGIFFLLPAYLLMRIIARP